MEEKFSERKPTRVKRYDYSKAGAYFVTICVQDRKPILSEIIRTNNTSVNETNGTAVGGVEDVAPYETTFNDTENCINIQTFLQQRIRRKHLAGIIL